MALELVESRTSAVVSVPMLFFALITPVLNLADILLLFREVRPMESVYPCLLNFAIEGPVVQVCPRFLAWGIASSFMPCTLDLRMTCCSGYIF